MGRRMGKKLKHHALIAVSCLKVFFIRQIKRKKNKKIFEVEGQSENNKITFV
jgi:hypothetical protein